MGKISKSFALILIIVMTISGLSLMIIKTINAQSSSLLVFDHFNGTALDPAKWIVEQGSNDSSESVTVANSSVSLDSTDGSFPRIVSAVNPFPLSGDFALEFDIIYTRITDSGTGIWVSQGPFVPYKDNLNANIMQVWASTIDGVTINFLTHDVYRDALYTHPSPFGYWNTSEITIRLEFSKGIYTLFLNGKEVTSGESNLRPNVFGMGLPTLPDVPRFYPLVWSSFKIDSIKILPSASISLSPNPSLTNLGLKVDVNGALIGKDKPLSGAKVILSYLIPDVATWMPITSAITDAQGSLCCNMVSSCDRLILAESRVDGGRKPWWNL